MRHFYRSQLPPAEVFTIADRVFAEIREERVTGPGTHPPARTYRGPLGTLTLSVHKEGGHYTFVQVDTDQPGESRLDRNAKRFFTALRRAENPAYTLQSSF